MDVDQHFEVKQFTNLLFENFLINSLINDTRMYFARMFAPLVALEGDLISLKVHILKNSNYSLDILMSWNAPPPSYINLVNI